MFSPCRRSLSLDPISPTVLLEEVDFDFVHA